MFEIDMIGLNNDGQQERDKYLNSLKATNTGMQSAISLIIKLAQEIRNRTTDYELAPFMGDLQVAVGIIEERLKHQQTTIEDLEQCMN